MRGRHEIGERTVGTGATVKAHRRQHPPARTATDTTTTHPGRQMATHLPGAAALRLGCFGCATVTDISPGCTVALGCHRVGIGYHTRGLSWDGFRQGSLSDKRRGLKRAALAAASEPSRPSWSQFLGFYSLARNRNRRWTALSDRPLDLSLCAVTITAGTVGPVRQGEVCPADEQTRATWDGRAGWREVNTELTTDTLAPAGWGLLVNSHHGPTL